MISTRVRAVTLVFAVAISLAACGSRRDTDGATTRPLVVRDAWARPADSGATGGVYITLANVDTGAIAITALSSPAAAAAELHQTMQMDGMVHMSARPNVLIEREGTLTMAPGGLHVMLTSLTRALRVGDSVALTVTLIDGRTIPVIATVRTATERAP